jgi:NADH pyrophosphatase NudC (nudix superfamily)
VDKDSTTKKGKMVGKGKGGSARPSSSNNQANVNKTAKTNQDRSANFWQEREAVLRSQRSYEATLKEKEQRNPWKSYDESFPRLGTKTKDNGDTAAAAAAAAAVATPATQTKEVSVEDLKTFMRQMAEMLANMAAKAAALCA